MAITVPTDAMLRRMSPADRAWLGKAGVTAAEAQVSYDERSEKDLQKNMENYLRQRNLFFIRSRMDKRPTIRKGLPDFTIILPGGMSLLVEAKVEGGVVSADQKKCFDDFWTQTGRVVHIVFNFDQFRRLIDQHAPPPP
jgi:hypothetical protein